MEYSFRTILVPVDFSINTDVAINKAIELADLQGTSLHLLHVQNSSFFPIGSAYAAMEKGKIISPLSEEEKLQQWKSTIEAAKPHIRVNLCLTYNSSIHKMISKKAREVQADLIVIGKHSHHAWFSFMNTVCSNNLAETTKITVLTVKPGCLHSKIKTVVLPVDSQLSPLKLRAITALSTKFRLRVHLVTFINKEYKAADYSSNSLVKSFRWVKDTLHCPVEYSVIHGSNRAKALMQFAEQIGADLMLLQPSLETKLGWPNRQLVDVLPAHSKMQLMIQPN
jgi:nucleotide-binding universal stress UspA family protein